MEWIITQNCKILSELKDYMHEYIQLWMSRFFNDHKFTILNRWSQQRSLYQHSQ